MNHECSDIFNDTCDGMLECLSIKGIINILKTYKLFNISGKNVFYKLIPYLKNYKYLLSDYHHILGHHCNNNDFEIIYKIFMNKNNQLKCNIKKCPMYNKFIRQRDKDLLNINKHCNDPMILLAVDILDSIHCYFIHSIDIGFRIKQNYIIIMNQKLNRCFWIDFDMIGMKHYLTQKNKAIYKFKTNKFITNILKDNFSEEIISDLKVCE